MRSCSSLDATVRSFLKREPSGPGAFAGAVVLVARNGEVVAHGAWGMAELFDSDRQVLQRPRPVTPDTIFDLASVTKVAATTLAIAALMDDAGLSPDDPVARFLPETHGTWVGRATLRQLLTHRSGLPDWLPFYLLVDMEGPAEERRNEAIRIISRLASTTEPGAEGVYSDLNFILLGAVVERASGQRLDHFVRSRLYEPMGLSTIGFNPPEAWHKRTAATSIGNPVEAEMCRTRTFPLPLRRTPEALEDFRRPRVLVGVANDGNCRMAFGGISGHAGLFADARSLAAIGQLMLDGGAIGGRQVVRCETARLLTSERLGWRQLSWTPAPEAYGHTGFTGTALHIDPARRTVVVVLTNRVHGAPPYAPHEPFLRPILEAAYAEL